MSRFDQIGYGSRVGRAVALLLGLFALLLPQTGLAQDEQRIVVLVNDIPISAYDIAQRVRFMSVTQRKTPSAPMRKRVTEDLISESIQLQEAKKNGVLVQKQEIDRVVENLAKRNNLSPQRLVSAFAQLGVQPRTFRRRIEAQIAWQKLIRRKFRHQISIGATQVDKALSEQTPAPGGTQGQTKTELQVQRVRLDLPENPNQRTIARRLVEAEALRGRVSACSELEGALRRISKASVKNIGRKKAEDFFEPSRALLMAARPGQLTPASVTSSGIELYAVCGRRAKASDDRQRRQVEAKLVGQEYEILALRHLRDLRQEAYVEYR